MKSSVAIAAAVVAAVAGLANWWSRWREDERVELVSKPLATLALAAVAATMDVHPASARPWFVVGLLACLAGDVALLPAVDRFIVGLASFLVGHVLFLIGALRIGVHTGLSLAVVPLAIVLAAVVGVRIVRAAREIRVPVAAYLTVILAMAVVVTGTGRPAAIVGAAAFVVSDSILGWAAFVRPLPWSPVAIMVTYHVALAGLVLGLR